MNLRKRKSRRNQVEIFIQKAEDTGDTATGSLIEERAFNNDSRGNKRVKLEETKIVLDETVKIEVESGDFNDFNGNNSDWEEVDEKANKRVNTTVSD